MTGCEVVLGLLTITYVMCDQIILKYLAPIKRFKTVHYKVHGSNFPGCGWNEWSKYVIHMKATELYVSVVLFIMLCNLKVRSYILNPQVKSWSVTRQMNSEI